MTPYPCMLSFCTIVLGGCSVLSVIIVAHRWRATISWLSWGRLKISQNAGRHRGWQKTCVRFAAPFENWRISSFGSFGSSARNYTWLPRMWFHRRGGVDCNRGAVQLRWQSNFAIADEKCRHRWRSIVAITGDATKVERSPKFSFHLRSRTQMPEHMFLKCWEKTSSGNIKLLILRPCLQLSQHIPGIPKVIFRISPQMRNYANSMWLAINTRDNERTVAMDEEFTKEMDDNWLNMADEWRQVPEKFTGVRKLRVFAEDLRPSDVVIVIEWFASSLVETWGVSIKYLPTRLHNHCIRRAGGDVLTHTCRRHCPGAITSAA